MCFFFLVWFPSRFRATLGARDFSSAVSGFCQVFIFSRLRRSWLRPTAENVSTFGKHRKFPPHPRKTSGTQGNLWPFNGSGHWNWSTLSVSRVLFKSFAFVGCRNNCFFSHTIPYILNVTQQCWWSYFDLGSSLKYLIKNIYFISAFSSGLKCNKSCISIGFVGRFGGQYTLFFFFYKDVVFPAEVEFSYFSADFRLKIFLYYSLKKEKNIMMLFTVLFISFELSWYGTNVLHVSSIELLLALNIWL